MPIAHSGYYVQGVSDALGFTGMSDPGTPTRLRVQIMERWDKTSGQTINSNCEAQGDGEPARSR